MFKIVGHEVGIQRDATKQEICSKLGKQIFLAGNLILGITLINVPYWWDRKYESLQATIYSLRPDLFTEKITTEPIPLEPVEKSAIRNTPSSSIYSMHQQWFNIILYRSNETSINDSD